MSQTKIHTLTFREAAERWLHANVGVVSGKTLGHYRWLLENHVCPGLKTGPEREADRDVALQDITEETVQALLERKRAEGLSENTVYMLPRLIRRVLSHAAAEGFCEAPEWQIKPETPQNEHPAVILFLAQERQLLQYLTEHPDPRNLALFLVLTTGISGSEVIRLTGADVSFRQGLLHVQKRTLVLDERQIIYLKKQQPEPLKATALRDRLQKVCKEAGVPQTTLTGLRRTFAVRQLEGGMGYDELAKTLNQKNDRAFRILYRGLVSPETKDRLERETLASRKVRQAPKHIRKPEKGLEIRALENKIEARNRELQKAGGQAREALCAFIENVLEDDKDGKLLVEYLRSNLRVAAMPSRERLSAQAIRRRVTRGFSKLTALFNPGESLTLKDSSNVDE